MNVDAIAAAIRAASFIAMLQAVGATAFLLLCARHLGDSGVAIRKLARSASFLALALVVVHYSLEAARMGGDLASIGDAELQFLALHSPLAIAAGLRILGLVLIAWASHASALSRTPAALGALGVVSAFLFVGHTAVDTHGVWLRPLLAIHVAVAAYWFGSLLPLLIVLKRESSAKASAAVDVFSAWAVWLVPSLFLAGIVLLAALTQLDPRVLSLPYGQILAFKLAAFLLLLGLAALNRHRLGPRLKSGQATATRALVRSIRVEIVLLMAVIAATGVLTALFSPD